MKHLRNFNESGSFKRISGDIIEVVSLITNYEPALKNNVFSVFDDLNTLSESELKEVYESLSTNRRENNSDEENLMIDLINHFNLV
jgi:hypothetical protein